MGQKKKKNNKKTQDEITLPPGNDALTLGDPQPGAPVQTDR